MEGTWICQSCVLSTESQKVYSEYTGSGSYSFDWGGGTTNKTLHQKFLDFLDSVVCK